MNPAKLEEQINAKIHSIDTSNPVQALKKYFEVRPINIRDKKLIEQDLKGFESIINKMNEKDLPIILQKLNRGQCEILLDYLHRFMQYVGQQGSPSNLSGGYALKIEEQVIKIYGSSIIITAGQRNDTIVTRRNNWK